MLDYDISCTSKNCEYNEHDNTTTNVNDIEDQDNTSIHQYISVGFQLDSETRIIIVVLTSVTS